MESALPFKTVISITQSDTSTWPDVISSLLRLFRGSYGDLIGVPISSKPCPFHSHSLTPPSKPKTTLKCSPHKIPNTNSLTLSLPHTHA
ncbi:hypothetical protein RJT34_02307 [Clitoria ternatea]|uniref:Uncharacterized protein n=1 Tax=Clitoria ternatea TaxID=43366 RepID=A0AAN9KH28_CLITE